jgi:hypothetical protein
MTGFDAKAGLLLYLQGARETLLWKHHQRVVGRPGLVARLPGPGGAGRQSGRISRIMAPLAPGSGLAITHLASDLHTEEMGETFNRLNAAMADPVTLRGRSEMTALLDGPDLVQPGVVQATRWRPDRETDADSQMWCGVARKDEGRA